MLRFLHAFGIYSFFFKGMFPIYFHFKERVVNVNGASHTASIKSGFQSNMFCCSNGSEHWRASIFKYHMTCLFTYLSTFSLQGIDFKITLVVGCLGQWLLDQLTIWNM